MHRYQVIRQAYRSHCTESRAWLGSQCSALYNAAAQKPPHECTPTPTSTHADTDTGTDTDTDTNTDTDTDADTDTATHTHTHSYIARHEKLEHYHIRVKLHNHTTCHRVG